MLKSSTTGYPTYRTDCTRFSTSALLFTFWTTVLVGLFLLYSTFVSFFLYKNAFFLLVRLLYFVCDLRFSLQEADLALNFDEQILEAAKSIAAAVTALVKAASAAQRELVSQGRVNFCSIL